MNKKITLKFPQLEFYLSFRAACKNYRFCDCGQARFRSKNLLALFFGLPGEKQISSGRLSKGNPKAKFSILFNFKVSGVAGREN